MYTLGLRLKIVHQPAYERTVRERAGGRLPEPISCRLALEARSMAREASRGRCRAHARRISWAARMALARSAYSYHRDRPGVPFELHAMRCMGAAIEGEIRRLQA